MAAAVAMALVAIGGGGGSAPAKGSFVGKLDGTDALVGIVSDTSRVRASICDSQTIATWFSGTLQDGRAELGSGDGPQTLALSLDGNHAQGTHTIAGEEHAFSANPADGKAGIYRTSANTRDRQRLQADWILLTDGTQRGAFQADADQNGVVRPAPTLKPVTDLQDIE
jgi:hypothetical protein